ncbi:MAG: hypothetical protein ABL958_07985 [Bdellovibrionia bacterium]
MKTAVRVCILALTGAILAFRSLGPAQEADLSTQNLNGVACGKTSAEYSLSFSDRVVLNVSFLDPKLSEDDNLKSAIEQKIRYFTQYFLTAKNLPFKVVRSSVPAEVTITSKRIAKYPFKLNIDWTEKPDLPIDDMYTRAAIKKGSTSRLDKSLEADYQARITVLTCGASGDELEIVGPVPVDPMLFYWNVPSSERRHLKWNASEAIANPCADNEVADFPHPGYFWYFWDPYFTGKDADGKKVDCTARLQSGRDFLVQKARLTKIRDVNPDFSFMHSRFSKSEGPLTAVFFFGYLDHQIPEPKTAEIVSLLEQQGRGIPADHFEWGSSAFLNFVGEARTRLREPTVTVAAEGDYTVAVIAGRLIESGREIQIKALLGPTDVFGKTRTGHWKWVPGALENSDIVVYAGHSGLGENFSLARAATELKIEASELNAVATKKPYQLLAFLSCYSYSYFGQDILDGAGSLKPARDIIYSAASLGFSRYQDTSIAIVEFVDRVLATGTFEAPARLKPADDFLVFKGFNTSGGGL